MLQLFLPGFPEGATPINAEVKCLSKEGRTTWFVGTDNYFSHATKDQRAFAFTVASMIQNGHARSCDFERSPLALSHRTIMNWMRQLKTRGHDSFFRPPRRRSAAVLTAEKIAECEQILSSGLGIAETARRTGLGDSTIRKAVSSQRIVLRKTDDSTVPVVACTKSERTREDAEAAVGMGTACTRAQERIAASIGVAQASAVARFEHCQDVQFGGVLAGLPALIANGLLSGIDKYLSIPKGFYSAITILITLGFMSLSRIRRPEGLRHIPPGELGKTIGLDRVPEVRTLREKVAWMATHGNPQAWMLELSKTWMEADPDEAGYLYLDGHVRVYHGQARLQRRYVSRERLCLRGTTDYWINDALGRPFFVVSKAVTDGLESVLLNDILPDLLAHVPRQPSPAELAENPLRHRFVVIFDREGANYSLLSALWKHRVAAITYRKNVTDQWNHELFVETEVHAPGGSSTRMLLAKQEKSLDAGGNSIPVIEVRRLGSSGHQTAIITTARELSTPVVAGRMFSRWCQENYFAYMMNHYDIDGLCQYGCEDLPSTTRIVNPAWRSLNTTICRKTRALNTLKAALYRVEIDGGDGIQQRAEKHEVIQARIAELDNMRSLRRKTPRKIALSEIPESERPQQLLPLTKMLTDTVKMIAYRAETALVSLLRPHLEKEDEARALIRELFVSSADIVPDESAQTLTVKIHRMASPAHDKVISLLLAELTENAFKHPETGMKMIFTLA